MARIRRFPCPAESLPWSPTKRTQKNARRACFVRSSWICAPKKIPVPISTLPTPKERDFCGFGTFGPHNLHENRPGTFQSEETLFSTYNVAGVRVFDIKDAFAPKEIAYWVPPTPKKLIDPRPNVALAAKTADILVTTDGLVYVDGLECRLERAAIRRLTTAWRSRQTRVGHKNVGTIERITVLRNYRWLGNNRRVHWRLAGFHNLQLRVKPHRAGGIRHVA